MVDKWFKKIVVFFVLFDWFIWKFRYTIDIYLTNINRNLTWLFLFFFLSAKKSIMSEFGDDDDHSPEMFIFQSHISITGFVCLYVCLSAKKEKWYGLCHYIHSFIHSLYMDFFWLFIINQRNKKKCKISSPILSL